jgi:hypothetical protein
MKAYTVSICGGFLALAVLLPLTGCAVEDGRPSLLPNADPLLRKTSTELAADAAKRSYPIDAPRGSDTIARAQYNLMEKQFEVANLSGSDMQNVEVWLNQKYVVSVPDFDHNKGKTLDFGLFYDSEGHHFDTDFGGNPVKSLQIYQGGKLYDVVAVLE